MMNKIRSTKGITLISLVITIIILLILAGVTINLTIGENGIFKTAKDATEKTQKESVVEKVQVMLSDYMLEKVTGTKTLEQYLNEQKQKGELDEVTNNGNGTITVEVEGYEITIKEDDLSILETVKAGGVKPQFSIITTKIDGSNISESEQDTLTEKMITINITNIAEFGNNYTIEVKDENGNIMTKEANVVNNVIGQASYKITKGGTYTIKVTGTKEEILKTTTIPETIKIAMPTIAESAMFSKAIGVIDIVWLDEENNVINEPLSPKGHLGGLTAIKYSENKWVEADVNNISNDWYKYEAQEGNKDEKTSYWANAKAVSGENNENEAYFVWIPRYAYKITYFDTQEHANAYKTNANNTTGIIGYSNIEGIIKVEEDGTEKLLNDSKPTNVVGTVKTSAYSDYIPHPAFEFETVENGKTVQHRAGIWVGKFESSGSKDVVRIVPDTNSLRSITVGNIFTACLGVKNTYSLTGDSHMMKNTEWGAVAYLAESKYGRNGTEIGMNSSNYTTGAGNYISNTAQSTTGNISGIYDMNGTSWEYVAGVLDSKLSNSSYYDFTDAKKVATKYYNTYSSYSESKKIKGDAVYETSTSGSGSTSWHSDYSYFVNSSYPVFIRGRCLRRWHECR